MLKKETWQELAKRTGVEAEKLQELITSESEEAVELSNVTILDDVQLETFKETIGKASAKTGARTMIEMEVKALRDKHELDFEGKTIENLLTSFANKQVTEAKIEPNKKVSDAMESVKNLQTTYNTDIAAKDLQISGLSEKINGFKTNSELTKHIPDGLTGIESRDFLTIAKTVANFDFDDEGDFVVKQNGKIKRDKMEKPIKPKDWLTDLAIEKKWIDSEGRGDGNKFGKSKSKFKTMNDVFKHMDKNKINPRSPDGVKLIADFNNLKE